jgi:hypothetical protein
MAVRDGTGWHSGLTMVSNGGVTPAVPVAIRGVNPIK